MFQKIYQKNKVRADFVLSLGVDVALKLSAVAVGFYTSIWLNSNLSPENYSQYNLIVGFTLIILSIIDLGIVQLTQKYYTKSYKV